jgi:hypothetical protein
MEPEVVVRVRKSDEQIVSQVIDQAIEEYKTVMKAEVKAFKTREVPCKVTIDKAKYLPEYDESE